MASLIEREAINEDMPKISRVIYNRLANSQQNMQRLQFDSTVNYLLDRQHITTTKTDREKDGPYNTYLRKGLTPTPIGSPSAEALKAAAHPESGNWLYFVVCKKGGKSCFTDNFDTHQKTVEEAQKNGIF
ncbi:endolytic transglycosylase MltG [Pseudonocardiaceae bacterium YIM PH 21723]|nr:endolytic transglycosylase MltG [Pseudonocardiaceae bacterium YIM PH 21723]